MMVRRQLSSTQRQHTNAHHSFIRHSLLARIFDRHTQLLDGRLHGRAFFKVLLFGAVRQNSHVQGRRRARRSQRGDGKGLTDGEERKKESNDRLHVEWRDKGDD